MQYDYFIYSIFIFYFFILIEIITQVKNQSINYSKSIFLSNLNCGMIYYLLKGLFRLSIFTPYLYLYQHFSIPHFLSITQPFDWVIGFFCADLAYYCYHRASHKIKFIWPIHAVHHQPKEMNLSVAMRIPAFPYIFKTLFYLPLANLGVPPLMILSLEIIIQCYQFFTHTELIRDWPYPLNFIFNSPSHHRVHHGVNKEYIDKNFGAVFIIWDRLFGTFKAEVDKVIYGVTESYPLNFSILANLYPWGISIREKIYEIEEGKIAFILSIIFFIFSHVIIVFLFLNIEILQSSIVIICSLLFFLSIFLSEYILAKQL